MGFSTHQLKKYFFAGYLRLALEMMYLKCGHFGGHNTENHQELVVWSTSDKVDGLRIHEADTML